VGHPIGKPHWGKGKGKDKGKGKEKGKGKGKDKGKGNGKVHPTTGHEDPEGEYRYSSTLYLTSALDGVGGKRGGRFTPGKESVPKGQSGQVRKISPLPGFDSRTVQSVASRYTNYAIPDP